MASNPEPNTEGSAEPRTSHRSVAIASCVLAGILLWLGVPRLVAAVIGLEAYEVLSQANGGTAPPVPQILDAAGDLKTAAGWVSGGEIDIDRGALLMHAAANSPAGERNALLDRAEAATVDGLVASPGQPSAWLRLAWLREQRRDAAGALAALRMSILAGSFEPTLMIPRIDMALRLRRTMTGEMVDLLKRQIRLAWVIEPEYVYSLGVRTDTGDLVWQSLNTLTDTEIARYARNHGGMP